MIAKVQSKCGQRRFLQIVAGVALLLAGPARSQATNLSIESTTLSFDPNASTWHVTSRVCNNESGGRSGSLLYELRLTQGSTYYSIGSRSVSDTISGGFCLTFTNMAISVNTNVPNGTYGIQLVVGEYSSGVYITRDSANYDHSFVRGGGGGGGGGGDDDICARNGWYGDGECDTFCPLPDPDCSGGGGGGSGGGSGGDDICARNGWYGDGECDNFCPLPDPDCSGGGGSGGGGGGGAPSSAFCGSGFALSNLCSMMGLITLSALSRRRRKSTALPSKDMGPKRRS